MHELMNGIQITELVYGSPTKTQDKAMRDQGPLLKLLLKDNTKTHQFFNKKYPSNISLEVRTELRDLQNRTKNISKEKLEFAKISETDHYQSWVSFLYDAGISVPLSFFKQIETQTDGFVYTLKYHYNRPRPFQLGYYHKLPIMQTIQTNANSPAFPSGHAFESHLFGLILAKRYPFAKEKIQEFTVKHSESRLDAGVHYRSDIEFGYELANWAFSTDLF